MQASGAPGATLNLTEVMDNCRIGSLQIRVFVLCLGSLIMDGFDVQAMGYVAPAMLGGICLAGLVYAYWLHSGDRRGMRKKY